MPTLFCHCSKKRLPLKSYEKLIDDHRYSSSPLPTARVSSPARTVTELDHLYCDEKENYRYKNLKKRGRPSKGSGVEHEVCCPMKLRVIDHDYTMMLPIHSIRGEVIPIINRNETIKLAVSKDNGVIQKSSTVENTHINLSVEVSSNNFSVTELPSNIAVTESSFSSESSLTQHLSSTTNMDFSFLDEHSVGTIEISCSTSDLEKSANFNKSDKNDNITNKLKNEVIKLRREKAVFRVRLSRLQKKYDSLIKILSGKFG